MTTEQQQAPDPTRWRGFTHEELYRLLNTGPGHTASTVPAARWGAVAGALDEVGHSLRTALNMVGTAWVGRAAGAAFDRLSPLSAWATATSEQAGQMRVAVESQGDHVAKARADMPAPSDAPPVQPDPAVPPAAQVVAIQNDLEPAENAQAAGEQRAFEVMAAYESATTQNLAALSPFALPAALLTDGSQHRHRGDGVHGGTTPSAAPGLHAPGPEAGERPRGGHGYNGNGTNFSGFHGEGGGHRPAPRVPLPTHGSFSGTLALEPGLGGAPLGGSAGSREEDKKVERKVLAAGNQAGVGAVNSGTSERVLGGGGGSAQHPALGTPAPGSSSGGAAPASTMGANGQPGAHAPGALPPGTPMHPGGAGAGAPMGGAMAPAATGDRMGMRRFAPEAIGSSQWFDGDDATPVRQVGGRRRDLGSTENVMENHNVGGEDLQLPPGVIGG